MCSGEALPASLVRTQHDVLPRAALYNLYGPTEATVDVTWWRCSAERDRSSVPIGHPIWNTQIHILDGELRPVPPGEIGNLYIGGVGRRAGTPAGRADRRAVRSGHAERRAGRADVSHRRSGAPAPRRRDRIRRPGDFQVKLRGFRIELGEIEARLREHPAVDQVVVLAREDIPADRRLVAYYTSRAGAGGADGLTVASAVESLRAHLAALLPDYMVPAAYVALPAIPLTSNGKVDRRSLKAPDRDAFVAGAYAAPEGALETRLAALWAEALNVPRVGRDDNFFALGGDSLLAAGLLERMRRDGIHAPLHALYAAPSIAGLAAACRSEMAPTETSSAAFPPDRRAVTPEMLPEVRLSQEQIDGIVATVPGGAGNVQDIYPAAPLQDGILFHHLMVTKGDPYLLYATFRFDTRERLDLYLRALQAVIDRHDVLRTALSWKGLPAGASGLAPSTLAGGASGRGCRRRGRRAAAGGALRSPSLPHRRAASPDDAGLLRRGRGARGLGGDRLDPPPGRATTRRWRWCRRRCRRTSRQGGGLASPRRVRRLSRAWPRARRAREPRAVLHPDAG